MSLRASLRQVGANISLRVGGLAPESLPPIRPHTQPGGGTTLQRRSAAELVRGLAVARATVSDRKDDPLADPDVTAGLLDLGAEDDVVRLLGAELVLNADVTNNIAVALARLAVLTRSPRRLAEARALVALLTNAPGETGKRAQKNLALLNEAARRL